MRTYPGLLTNAVRSALRSKHDLMLENLALRQQLAVLTRQRARTRTKPADRLFWSWLSRYWSRRPATTISARGRGPHRWPADPGRAASRVRASRRVTLGRTTFSGSTGASRRPARFRDLRFASRRVSDASQSGDAMPLYEARENNDPDHRSRDRRRRRAHPRRSRRGRGAAAPGRPLAAAAHARGSLATRRGAGRGRYSRLSTLASQRDSAADRRASTIRTIASVSRRQYASRSARSCSRRPDDVSSLSVSRHASVASVPSWTARSS